MKERTMTDGEGFHAKDGWFFKRGGLLGGGEDSDVSIQHGGFYITFDKDTWASIVASVSAYGGNADTFESASALHEGRVVFTEPPSEKQTLTSDDVGSIEDVLGGGTP